MLKTAAANDARWRRGVWRKLKDPKIEATVSQVTQLSNYEKQL